MAGVGFTGTREGTTHAQFQSLRIVLADLRREYTMLHHGDCVGADEEAHLIWTDPEEPIQGLVTIHPPTTRDGRAYLTRQPGHTVLPMLPHLERNEVIVDECDVLVSCPLHEQPESERLSGTWWTVRYALSRARCTIVVRPDGHVVQMSEPRQQDMSVLWQDRSFLREETPPCTQ